MGRGTLEKLDAIRRGELSAVENVQRALERIKKQDKRIKAFIELNPHALADAEAIDRKLKRGERVGKLAGLAIGVKSNINVTGLLATCASRTLENYVSTYDAEAIRRVRDAGGVIVGMSNMDEFACGSSGETSAFGTTDNPAALGHIPGGSSSGGAAAVAAGMCDLCLASDTGGSIRNPASHCGVVGIRPTQGLVPGHGLIELAVSFDQIGPLAPDVYGAALMLETIAGHNPNECTTLDLSSVNYLDKLNIKIESIRVGTSPKFSELTDPEIIKVIDGAVEKLRDLGAEVVEVELPHLEKGLSAYYVIMSAEFFSATRKFDGRKYGRRIEEVCGDEVLRRIKCGEYISRKEQLGKYYQRALQVRTLLRREFEEALDRVDVIVGPTVPKLPHELGTKLSPAEMRAYDYLTSPISLAGTCAGVIKAGEVDGIPVGLQVQGKVLGEGTVLRVMNALEAVK